MKCIFCDNALDNSDEHIILDSLNGKLHSKEIICSVCNHFFGTNLDNVAKKFFNVILLIFEFKNASGLTVENLKGEDQYLFQKNLAMKQVKLKVQEDSFQGKKIISITGNEKDALKYFEKHSKRLEESGIKIIAKEVEKSSKSIPLRVKAEFKISPQLTILLNKIAIEFCGYHKVSNLNIEELIVKTRALDANLSNVRYCNLNEEIRKFETGEVTHYITLQNASNTVYVYIELFNVVCAVVILQTDYKLQDLGYYYFQNALTGEKLEKYPKLNTSNLEAIINTNYENEVDLSSLVNKLFFRKREKDFNEVFDFELKAIIDDLEEKLQKEQITNKEYKELYLDRSTTLLAELQIENPYLFDDIDDANNDDINYIHSNIRLEQLEEFKEKYKGFIGHKIKYDGKIYLIEELVHIPFASQNGIEVVRVNFVLFNGFDRIYIPYSEFFEGIKQVK